MLGQFPPRQDDGDPERGVDEHLPQQIGQRAPEQVAAVAGPPRDIGQRASVGRELAGGGGADHPEEERADERQAKAVAEGAQGYRHRGIELTQHGIPHTDDVPHGPLEASPRGYYPWQYYQ